MKKKVFKWIIALVLAIFLFWMIAPKTIYFIYTQGNQIMYVKGKKIKFDGYYKKFDNYIYSTKYMKTRGNEMSGLECAPKVEIWNWVNSGLTIQGLIDLGETYREAFPKKVLKTKISDIEIKYDITFVRTEGNMKVWFYGFRRTFLGFESIDIE
jgi:hypothetical protein